MFGEAAWREVGIARVECGCNETLSPSRLRGVDKSYVNMDVFEIGQTNILVAKRDGIACSEVYRQGVSVLLVQASNWMR